MNHHPCTAAAKPAPAGATSITLAILGGSLAAIPPGAPIKIAGSDETYAIKEVSADGVATLDRPLVQEIAGPAPHAVYFLVEANVMGDHLVDTLTGRLQAVREALARGEAHAQQTVVDRAEAEKAHANLVADSMETGKPVPAKPAKLSALQTADASAEAALDILRKRVLNLEGEVFNATVAETHRRMRAQFQTDGEDARDALELIMDGAARLSDAVGSAALQSRIDLIGEALGVFRNRPSRHDLAVAGIRDFAGKHRAGAGSAAHMVEGTINDEIVAAKWPDRESIQAAARQAAAS